MLHLSPAKVENSFPSLMECHSHFQREADERERSGAPPSQNRYCMAGSQGPQRCPGTPVGRRCRGRASCKRSLALVHKANWVEVTVSNTWWSDNCLVCTRISFSGNQQLYLTWRNSRFIVLDGPILIKGKAGKTQAHIWLKTDNWRGQTMAWGPDVAC